MAAFASGGRVDESGLTYRFALAQPMRIHQSQSANQVAVDLVPNSFAGTPPDLPPPPAPPPRTVDIATLPLIAVRSGAYRNFTRLVFDWPQYVKYSVFPGAGKLGIRFESMVRVDVSAIARFAPPWVKNASWRVENKGTVVEFDTDQASGFHDFRDGTKVVLDVLAPKTDADSYRPPGDGKATVTPLNSVAGKPSAVSAAQAAEIAADGAEARRCEQAAGAGARRDTSDTRPGGGRAAARRRHSGAAPGRQRTAHAQRRDPDLRGRRQSRLGRVHARHDGVDRAAGRRPARRGEAQDLARHLPRRGGSRVFRRRHRAAHHLRPSRNRSAPMPTAPTSKS